MPANLPLFASLPNYAAGAGVRTEYGLMLPPATRVVYVRSTGVQSGDNQEIVNRLLPTLAAAILECRSGLADIIYVLPGHTETVTSTSFTPVAGMRIIGLGDLNRDDAPTFTWSSAAATWAINAKNVYITGLRLLLDNFNGVTNAINITASGCTLANNYIRTSNGASLKATTAITVGSGATDCNIMYNEFYGVAAGVCTDMIKLLGATTPDRCKIIGNDMHAAATSANGLINVSVAALGLNISDNEITNLAATSVAGINFANVACTGTCTYNCITVFSTGAQTGGTTGITVGGTNNLVGYHQNFVVNDVNKSGILQPAADT